MKANTAITLLGASLLAFSAHVAAQATPDSTANMKHGDMPMPRTPEERAKMANTMFDKIDTNKDGSLSRAEFVEHHKAMSMDHGCMGMGHHRMDHHGMEQRGMDHHGMEQHDTPGGPAPKQAFVDWDANKDGRLSKAEMAKHPMAAHFGMMDADEDGYLSPKEFSAHGN